MNAGGHGIEAHHRFAIHQSEGGIGRSGRRVVTYPSNRCFSRGTLLTAHIHISRIGVSAGSWHIISV